MTFFVLLGVNIRKIILFLLPPYLQALAHFGLPLPDLVFGPRHQALTGLFALLFIF